MNRTFTLCFSLYPIALPFGYVLIYTFYHYAVPDANSNLTNIQVGAITVAEVGNGIKDTEIRFPASFSKTPRVVVSAVSGTNNKNYGIMTVFADNITTNGFTLRIANTSADVFTPAVNWIAIAK